MIRALAFLAIFSVAMVVAMVQFIYTLVSDDPRKAENQNLWGAIYIGLWVGIGVALWDLIRRDRAPTTSDWAAMVLAPVGWLTFNAFWLSAWGAIEVRNAEERRVAPSARALKFKRLLAIRRTSLPRTSRCPRTSSSHRTSRSH